MPDASVMTPPAATQTQTTLAIPDDVVQKFPDLVEMIKKSESMDADERQYWIDVLPIMSDEQILNLRGILDNEKKQLEAINKNYQTEKKQAVEKTTHIFDETAFKEKKMVRMEAEKIAEEQEKTAEDQLLKQLSSI